MSLRAEHARKAISEMEPIMHLPRMVRRRVVLTVIWSGIVLGQAGLIGVWGAGALHSASARAAQPRMDAMPGMDQAMLAASRSAPITMMLHKKVVRVTIDNFAFLPARLEVSPGTKIIWTNKDGDPHTVSSTKNIWSSDALDTDGTFSRAFKKDGTFPYYCKIHPFMQATVVVKS